MRCLPGMAEEEEKGDGVKIFLSLSSSPDFYWYTFKQILMGAKKEVKITTWTKEIRKKKLTSNPKYENLNPLSLSYIYLISLKSFWKPNTRNLSSTTNTRC